ncbi:hypothetical protein CLV71_11623 [Actinophytocola oryzae]|uniref:Uncharacterized protein n=1 Tax=Actinophytocola oryzae TaxID=502181 RepID=A0A4R7V1E9_9PSEU|nr:hypothetical protein CLV71_11623 [Actinophytocola oryzae]
MDLDALDDVVDADLAAADRTVAEVRRRTEGRLRAEAERWREFATGPDAAPEWRRVVERVGTGELCWYDLAAGELWADEDVAAARAASMATRQAAALPDDLDEEPADSPLRRD